MKARKVHGDKYDYSKVEYVDAHTKVTIICPKHGEFEQRPKHHTTLKSGCRKCNKYDPKKLTTKDFIRKAREVHGDKYDYSRVEYDGFKSKVLIICPEHGEFEQQAGNHLTGKGCSKCSKRTGMTTKDFIVEARKVHGDKYDYSITKYCGMKKKLTIICSLHGEFEQQAYNHLKGCNCPKCVGGTKSNTIDFVPKARKVHGDKYDYSLVKYENNHTPITIICSLHGEFNQIPSVHLGGSGCPICMGKGGNYLPFDELRKIIREVGLNSRDEYQKWWEDNKIYCQNKGIPKYPDSHYSKHQ